MKFLVMKLLSVSYLLIYLLMFYLWTDGSNMIRGLAVILGFPLLSFWGYYLPLSRSFDPLLPVFHVFLFLGLFSHFGGVYLVITSWGRISGK